MGWSRKKVNQKAEEDEDRISRLSDDLIHQILSFIDAKEAVQTTLLSTRWSNLWKSLSILNFDRHCCNRIPDFSKFVAQFLLHRNHQTELSVFNISCWGVIPQPLIELIATYGASHNLQHLNISSNVHQLPLSVFTGQSLKQLCLKGGDWKLPKPSWNLPALTTLFLKGCTFRFILNDDGTRKSLDPFSSLLNLKNLSLIGCETGNLAVFQIMAPQLENLEIEFNGYMLCQSEFVISAPKLSSFKYTGDDALRLSAGHDLDCLDKVHIDIDTITSFMRPYECKQRCQGMCPKIINMFHQLRFAKFVTLNLQIVEVLSWVLELLENQPSPFCKLERLKIERGRRFSADAILSNDVLTFLCNSSPASTIINASKWCFEAHDGLVDI